MNSRNIVDAIRQYRIISILRGLEPGQTLPAVKALYKGGVRLLEITFAQHSPTMLEDTASAIRSAREEFGSAIMVGAGTVLTCEQADVAARAGAEFLLSATCDEQVIRRAKALGLGMIPGAMTPTEIDHGYRWGADVIKVFPAGNLGQGYLKSIRAPLSHIPMIAVGGVEVGNLCDFWDAGMLGAGIGASLASPEVIRRGDWEELTRRAARYCEAVERYAEQKEHGR